DRPLRHADDHAGSELEPELVVLDGLPSAVQPARTDDLVADLQRRHLLLLRAHLALARTDEEEPDDGEHDEDEEVCRHVTPVPRTRAGRAPRPCSSGTPPARSRRARW